MKRWIVLVALTAVLAVGVTIAAPPGAAHAIDGVPGPINVLPSIVKAGWINSPAAGKGMVYLTSAVYAAMKDPAFIASLKAKAAATATTTQLASIAAEKGRFKLPAFKGGPLLKTVAGGALSAFMAYDVGFSIGNGILTLSGIDTAGTLCNKSAGGLGEFQAVISGVDCEEWQAAQDWIANQDIDLTMKTGYACSLQSGVNYCTRLSGTAIDPVSGKTHWCTQSYSGSPSNPIGLYANNSPSASRFEIQLGNLSWNTYGAQGFSIGAAAKCGTVPGGNLFQWSGTLATQLPIKSIRFANGNTAAVIAPDPNPSRTFRCVIAGSNGQTYTAVSAAFKETDESWPEPKCADLPAGVSATNVQIWQDGTDPAVKLYDQSVTPEYSAAKTNYADCFDGSCILELLKNGISCFDQVTACADWFEDPGKATSYTCRWGSHAVALTECTVYRPTFNPKQRETGDTLGDPTTGDPLPNPRNVQDQAVKASCFPSGWGLANPVEWVYRPVRCVLEWAFVPKQEVVDAQFTRVSTALDQKMPGQLARTIGAWEFQPPPSGCDGITVSVFFLGPPFKIMNACPGSVLADLAFWSRVFGNVAFSVYGTVAVSRHVARIFEFPGLGDQS